MPLKFEREISGVYEIQCGSCRADTLVCLLVDGSLYVKQITRREIYGGAVACDQYGDYEGNGRS